MWVALRSPLGADFDLLSAPRGDLEANGDESARPSNFTLLDRPTLFDENTFCFLPASLALRFDFRPSRELFEIYPLLFLQYGA